MNHSDEKMFCPARTPQINNNEEPTTSNSDVDILECGSSEPIATVYSDPDATECSSSFSDTFPGPNDVQQHELSDAEVESKFVEAPLYFSENRLFEKKKLTEHWRRHIQPEIWRCKLLELWIKQLVSRADRYDRQIEAYEHEKQYLKKNYWPDNCTSREVPFERRTKTKVMRRKKRKQPEGTVDILQTVNQILSPYLEKKQGHEDLSTNPICNKQADQDIKVHNDDLGINFCWSMLKIKNHDSFLEQILFDIDVAQLRVHELKSQLNNVICNSSTDIFSSPGMFNPGNKEEYRQSLSPRCSPVNHGDVAPFEATSTPYGSDFENDEKAIPGSADSSFIGASHTDVFENTVDLLAINLTHARYQMRNEVADDILINNQAAEEFHEYEIGHQKQHDTLEDDENLSIAHKASSSETETDPEIASASERRPAMKRARRAAAELHLRRSKRKRKLRRPSPGSWNGETWKKKHLKKQH